MQGKGRQQKAPQGKGSCNTKNSPTHIDTTHRGWIFTRFDYTEENIETLKARASLNKGNKYIFGREICPTTKKPHIQGYINFKSGLSFDNFKIWLKEIFKDTKTKIAYAQKGTTANYLYCSKEGNFVANFSINMKTKPELDIRNEMIKMGRELVIKDEYNNGVVKWSKFQQEVIDILEAKPDGRKIYYFWEAHGNIGKSYLTKWIRCRYEGVIVAEGKYTDVAQQAMLLLDNKQLPKICILDLPRSFNTDFMSWTTIEKLKNGSIVSGKYEGGVLDFPKPHVIIFANEPPNIEMLSLDRWVIKNIRSDSENDDIVLNF